MMTFKAAFCGLSLLFATTLTAQVEQQHHELNSADHLPVELAPPGATSTSAKTTKTPIFKMDATRACVSPNNDGGMFDLERIALISTLTELGVVSVQPADPTPADCDVIVTYWTSRGPNGLSLDYNHPDLPFVQVTDYGADRIPNSFNFPARGTPKVAINNQPTDAVGQELTKFLPLTWNTFGFGQYGSTTTEVIGYITDANIPASINVNGQRSLAGVAGTVNNVYIGWNVYGNLATIEDKQVLLNAIEWAVDGVVSNSGVTGIRCGGADCAAYNETQETYHATIGEAINMAADEDMIRVAPGTYTENIVASTKNLRLSIEALPE